MTSSILSVRRFLPVPRFVALLVFLLLTYGLWFSTQTFAADEPTPDSAQEQIGATALQASFDIIGKNPQPSAFAGVILSNSISAGFNGDLNTDTVAANFVIRGNQQGRFNGTFSYDSNSRTLNFAPERDFAFGEQVSVIGSSAIKNSGGDALTPAQWTFKAGYIQKRCIQGFQAINEFTPVWSSATAWADFDRDGDLDALIAGKPLVGNPITRIYRNDDGHFQQVDFGLTGVREAALAWGDYDNDYDMDILLAGTDASGRQVTQLYRNEGGTAFSRITTSLTPVTRGGLLWVDYDSDGQLDIFLHGDSTSGSIARLYHNNGNNNFAEITTNFPGVNNSAADWADYDNDGDPDLLLTGINGGTYISTIYNNNNGTFTAIPANLQPVGDSAVAWADYDGDGDEDIVISGETSPGVSAPVTQIYRNDAGLFTNINAGLLGVLDGAVAWGDFDNDGDLDLLVGGKDATEEVSTTLYQNHGGSFALYPTKLSGINLGSLSWGDFDGDYDNDILLTGFSVSDKAVLATAAGGESIVTTIYRNYDCPSDVSITQTVVPTTVLTSEVVTPQPITITLTFLNAGPVTATKVTIDDLIPDDITVMQVVSTTTDSSVKITDTGATPFRWRVSDLLVGQGGIITLTGEVNPTVGAVYTNTATIFAAKDITLTDNVAAIPIVVPFHLTQPTPAGSDAVGAPFDSPLSMAFDAALRPASIGSQSFRLYGTHSGSLGLTNGSYNAGDKSYGVRANRAFVQGEIVTAIGTAAITSLPGAPLIPYQWQFVAGKALDRCVGDFAPRSTGIPGLDHGAVSWGDYDRDGDADLVVIGQSSQGIISRIYRNDGNNLFTNIGAPLTGTRDGAATWVDYDADGDLDLFLTGSDGSNPVANLYHNEGGAFVVVATGFTAVTNSAAAWLDYNNDGFLDLVLSGQASGVPVSLLYRNNGGASFTLINAGLVGLSHGDIAGADYDKDGDIDLLLSGSNGGGNPITILYRNENGTFVDSAISLTGVSASAVAWADYDKDGDPDLLLTGNDGSNNATILYNNDGGTFSTVATALPALANGTVAWGDYDNDGVLDLLLSGTTSAGRVAAIYHQNGGTFTALDAGLTAVDLSAAAWGDYDGDADLDLLVLGNDGTKAVTALYRNTDCISDLGVTKEASAVTALAGDTITYTIVFTNAGPQPALNVVISDILPADLTNLQVVSSTIGAGVAITDTDATTGKRWLVSALAVNEGGIITVTAEVLPGLPGDVFYNIVRVSATHDITPTNNAGVAVVGRPFHITDTMPAAAQIGFPLNGAITATFDAAVDPFSASDQSLLVYGEQSGRRSGTVGYNEVTGNLIFTPTTKFHNGETVNVIGTAALASSAGAPLQPYQWHFVAEAVDPERCLAGFGRVTVPFPALTKSSGSWADYDKDGDLDLLLAGSPDGTARTIKLYRNDGNSLFTEMPTTFVAIHSGAVVWGDYDRDGDPDLLVTGSGSSGPVAKIYRNDNGLFVDLAAPLAAVSNSAAAWGDYDNDGDLDLLISGTTNGTTGLSQLYRNDNGIFSAQATSLPGLYRGAVQWGDYDADGDLDLLLAGTTDGTNALTAIYRNDGTGHFVDAAAGLPGIYDGAATWSDYDGDHDLDPFLVGLTTGGGRIVHLSRNDGNVFSDVTANGSFTAVDQASAQWGDYDNDGAIDLLVTGTTDGSTPLVQLMANIGNDTFIDINTGFDAIHSGLAIWGDYDGDRDLDLLLTGSGSAGTTMRLYRSRDCVSDLDITNTVSPASVLPGELVTYTLTIKNSGPQVATRVVLTDLIPVEALVDLAVDSSLSLTQIGPPYVWQLPNIAPGSGGVIRVHARTSYASMGTTINSAATIFAREDVTKTNNVSSVPLTVRAPLLSFAAATAEADEGSGTATIRVTLSEPNYAGAVMVTYQSSQGTAQPGGDYIAVNSTITIPAGQTEATFAVPLIEDEVDEANETVQLTLSNLTGAVAGATMQMVLTIVDNDAPPTLAVSGGNVVETAASVDFTFQLSAASGQLVTLTISTVNGTATAPTDFIALTNVQIVIPIGATTAKVSVTLVDDGIKEDPEEFYLSVSAVNATVLSSQGAATIGDNDEFKLYMPVIRRLR